MISCSAELATDDLSWALNLESGFKTLWHVLAVTMKEEESISFTLPKSTGIKNTYLALPFSVVPNISVTPNNGPRYFT